MRGKITLIVGFVQTAKDYMRQNHLSPNEVKIITEPEQLYGYKDVPIVFVGEYYKLPKIHAIEDLANAFNLPKQEVSDDQ
jgi:hypothetical protein